MNAVRPQSKFALCLLSRMQYPKRIMGVAFRIQYVSSFNAYNLFELNVNNLCVFSAIYLLLSTASVSGELVTLF